MKQAIQLNINGHSFLISESCECEMEYIRSERNNIIKCIEAYEKWLKNPLSDMPPHPDMTEFKEKTGIIGAPFNMHDATLYALDRNIEIVAEIEI